jgi:uncharacterized protein (TIGR02246 family)
MTFLVQVAETGWRHGKPTMMMALLVLLGGVYLGGVNLGGVNLGGVNCWGQAANGSAQEEGTAQEKDEQAIREAVASYVSAFNRQDAKAVADHWSPEAVYVTPIDGRRLLGREAIEKQFKSVFDNTDGLKIDVVVDAIQFVSPNVAVEQGRATFKATDAEARVTEYSAVHVRRDGAWLLDRVEEKIDEVLESNYEHLKPLQWLVGTWVDEDDTGRIETVCHWTKNQNFLHRAFTVSDQQGVHLSGMQIIGWDAVEKRIRSWTFDSDGGFATGIWSADATDAQEPESWHVRKKGHTATGHTTTAVNVLTRRGDSGFAFKSVSRTFDGQILPNIAEVIVRRQ